MSRSTVPALLGSLVCTLLAPVTVHAYCRTTTEPPTLEQVRTQECVTEGYPLYWRDLEIVYGFNPERASQDLDEATVRRVFAEGFAEWASVECSDGSPGFVFEADEEPYSELEPEHSLDTSNYNAMLFRPADEWVDEELYPADAYALTGVWYDRNSGRLLGADMEINEGRGPYAVCPDSGCEGSVSDLANVVTHEIGHMLGFAHSADPGATMYYEAPPGEVSKRDLEVDDMKAVCAVYSPTAVLDRTPPKEEKKCSIDSTAPADAPLLWGLGLVLAGVFVRRRNRR
jgi:MYXO-CTERM domain-containing protein